MADELIKQSQLARIVVPAITDAEYSKNLADAFEKINDNFKKIASLPFLQGVQGDSYQLEEYPIWKKYTTENWILTEDGKILLDSIFGMDTTKDGNSFKDIRACIGKFMPEENGVSPIDFFMSEDKNTIVNNSLYFYVIKDDTGNIIEKQLGQYYYFVDGRLKEVGSIYNSENAGSVLSEFNDYTGFYQYKYNAEDTENSNGEYIKVEILPTIYYDQNKNDICWKFNGNETGISAIGIKGSDGKDADLSIVKVDLNNENGVYNNNATSGKVIGILDTSANNGESAQWFEDETYFKTGKALIYMSGKIPKENLEENSINHLTGETETDEITINDFAYGEIVKQDIGYIAYWEPNCVFSKILTNNAFTQYFYNLGTVSYTNNAAYFLAIPSIQDRISSTNEAKQRAHIIKGYDGDKNNNIESLNIFHSENAFDEGGNQNINATESGDVKTLNIKNYGVNISKGGAVISSGGIQVTTEKPTTMTGGAVANVNSNVLTGHNNPGNDGCSDFPDDIKKGGYPLVTMSYNTDGSESKNCLVFGNGDIYALNWNKTTNKYEPGTLCLQDRTSYFGKTLIGGSFEVARGTASFGGVTKITNSSSSTNTQTGALVVAGGAGIGGAVNIGSSLEVGGTAKFTGPVTLGSSSSLTVGGTSVFEKDVTFDKHVTLGSSSSLTVGGTSIFNESVVIQENLGVTGTLNVNGISYLYNEVKIYREGVDSDAHNNGALVVTGGVGIGKNLNVQGNLGVTGKITGNNGLEITTGGADITGAVNIGGITRITNSLNSALNVTGGVRVGKKLNVGSTDSAESTETGYSGALVVDGGVGIKKNLIVGGTSEFKNLVQMNNLQVLSDLYASGIVNIFKDDNSDSKTTGALVVTGGAGIGKNLNVGETLGVTGKITGNNGLDITTGGATISGDSTITGNATITGKITGSSGLGITTGGATISGDSTITGNATITGKITGSSGLGITGAATITGKITGNNGLDITTGGAKITGKATTNGDVGLELHGGSGERGGGTGLVVYGGAPLRTKKYSKSIDAHGDVTIDGITTITSDSGSTNTETGALVVTGGVGIGGDVNIAGVTKFTNLSSSTDLENAALMVDGDTRFKSRVRIDGVTKITDDSNSYKTPDGVIFGALVVDGGVGIGSDLYIGGSTKIESGASSTSVETGALVVDGGVGIDGDIYLSGSAHIGVLIVEGSIDGDGGIKIEKGGSIYGGSSVQISGGIGLIVEGGYGGSNIGDTGTIVVDGGVGLDVLGGSGITGGTGIYVKGGDSYKTGLAVGGVGLYVEGGTSIFMGGDGIVAKGGIGAGTGRAIVSHGNIAICDTSGLNPTTISSNADGLSISRNTIINGNLTVNKLLKAREMVGSSNSNSITLGNGTQIKEEYIYSKITTGDRELYISFNPPSGWEGVVKLVILKLTTGGNYGNKGIYWRTGSGTYTQLKTEGTTAEEYYDVNNNTMVELYYNGSCWGVIHNPVGNKSIKAVW